MPLSATSAVSPGRRLRWTPAWRLPERIWRRWSTPPRRESKRRLRRAGGKRSSGTFTSTWSTGRVISRNTASPTSSSLRGYTPRANARIVSRVDSSCRQRSAEPNRPSKASTCASRVNTLSCSCASKRSRSSSATTSRRRRDASTTAILARTSRWSRAFAKATPPAGHRIQQLLVPQQRRIVLQHRDAGIALEKISDDLDAGFRTTGRPASSVNPSSLTNPTTTDGSPSTSASTSRRDRDLPSPRSTEACHDRCPGQSIAVIDCDRCQDGH